MTNLEMNILTIGFHLCMFLCVTWLNCALFTQLSAEFNENASFKCSKKQRYIVATICCGLVYVAYFGVTYDTIMG